MNDQALRISVAEACGLKVILPKDYQRAWLFPKGSVIFYPKNPHEGRLVLSQDYPPLYTASWNPLDDLKLAFECAEKVWTKPWSFSIKMDFEDRKYYCVACNESSEDYDEYISDFFAKPSRAICDAIHQWRTRTSF